MPQDKNVTKPSENYTETPLRLEDLAPHPMAQFRSWMKDAKATGEPMPEAMSIATATPEGIPSTRMVLCKGCDENGFVFYTNYGSQKSRELESNPYATLLFHWKPLARQVQITGTVERVPREMSEAYFATRPRGSQIGAWASPQSQPTSHVAMIAEYAAIEERFEGRSVTTPPNWGGYLIRPTSFQFWQGRSSRFHDRFQYNQQPDRTWTITRLAP